MARLILILGDQLTFDISSLAGSDPQHDLILMAEVMTEATYVPHHQKKIAFIFSAMRHFAEALRGRYQHVHYHPLDAPENSGSLRGEVQRVLSAHAIEGVVVTQPGEYRLFAEMQSWESILGVPVEMREDDRFLCDEATFNAWAAGRKQVRMGHFYPLMRKQYDVLMDGDQPVGGQWSFDADNRKPPNLDLSVPAPIAFEPDVITEAVIGLVAACFSHHFGQLLPFQYAVTHAQAEAALADFIAHRLPYFGDYQDAMIAGEPLLYHAHIGLYLNCGLLAPLACIQAAEAAYHAGAAPLNAVEGFVRQVMGWREYVRGIYWLNMPEYAERNALSATRDLPAFYWTGKTDMQCVQQCVKDTAQHAYAHHIQRLMVLGNFALLIGVAPAQLSEWFLAVYADAYEWVELPNVLGMALFADGGYLATKPYASGGQYIHKMSNYCEQCVYNVKKKEGETACPYHYLYWHFLVQHRAYLGKNPRLMMMYRNYDRMSDARKAAIATDSTRFLSQLDQKFPEV